MPAEVLFGGPGHQRRATVAFRLVLAVPHLALLAALIAAAVPVAFAGWWAALLTGRLPGPVASFLSGAVRYGTRVYAYLGLLTDRYPPFGLADSDYVVRVASTPGPLEPLPVLFRFVLVVPAAAVVGVATTGWLLAGPLLWLGVLVRGRPPRAVFDATAAVLRYLARWWAYALLLTPDYPLGLRAGEGQAPGRRLVPSAGGRALLGLLLALGVLPGVGLAAAEATVFGSAANRVDVRLSVASAHDTLAAEVDAFQRASSGCAEPACDRAAAARLASAFRRFGDRLRGIDFGSDLAAPAAAVEEDGDLMAATLDRMAAAPDLAAYRQASDAGHLSRQASTFDSDYRRLFGGLG